MSLTGLSLETSKLHKKSFHCRNDSDELDVFEAARYFSGYNEVAGYNGTAAYTTPKVIMREDHKHSWRGGGGRMSLDVPIRNPLPQYHHHHHHQQSYTVEKQMLKEKKYKQPSSPGGRLASFLNSLFNQTSSKKKKSKSTTQSIKDDDESPGGRRKRRSSISHFRSSSATDTKSLYSSSSSGFRTPPAPCTQTPTKGCKEFRSYADHKKVVSLPKQSIGNVMKSTERKNRDLSWSDEKLKFNDGLLSERSVAKINPGKQVDRSWADQNPSDENEFRKFNDEVDDGGESDSSSDLFELQNYDLGIYPTGLPVYETTHMDSIKRGAPISNGAL